MSPPSPTSVFSVRSALQALGPEKASDQAPPVAEGPRLLESGRRAREYALVLRSMDIPHELTPWGGVPVLWVEPAQVERAQEALRRYESENVGWPPRARRDRATFGRSWLPALGFLALAAFAMVTGPLSQRSLWFERGIAVSETLLTQEPWRAVTALTLHADAVHVVGNILSGSLFATALQRRLGSGAASLAIVAAGALGNGANALFHQVTGEGDHGSLGASTAVFAAVGLLASLQLAIDRQRSRGQPRERSWQEKLGPLVAGAALLGTLGAGPRTDLGAHLFGFLAGALLGLPIGWRLRQGSWLPGGQAQQVVRASPLLQLGLGGLTLGLVLGSWALALR